MYVDLVRSSLGVAVRLAGEDGMVEVGVDRGEEDLEREEKGESGLGLVV